MAEQATGETGTVGMGIPGSISPYTGVVKTPTPPELNGQPFDKDLTPMDREVLWRMTNCLAVSGGRGWRSGWRADRICGHYRHRLRGGRGVRWALAYWRQRHQRASGGTIRCRGWIKMNSKYRAEVPCYCGKQGCIETFISGTGFAHRLSSSERSAAER